jgi:HEAT repeat protein
VLVGGGLAEAEPLTDPVPGQGLRPGSGRRSIGTGEGEQGGGDREKLLGPHGSSRDKECCIRNAHLILTKMCAFLASSAAVTLLLLAAVWAPARAQTHDQDYDNADPWTGVRPEKRGPNSAAVAGFVRALTTSDPVLCQFAATAIGNNWSHWEGDYPTGHLKDEENQEARREPLSRPVSDPAAVALLIESLASPHACVRRASARMLGRSGEPETVRQLRSALRDGDGRVREAAALGLASAQDFGAFHDLARALRDKEQPVVRMATYALGELEDARAVKPLGALLRADDPDTRATAAAALGEIEDIRATERLAPLVRDRETRVRLAAVNALGEIEDYRATGALIAALRDKEVSVRRAAAEALGEAEDPKGTPALSQAIDDGDLVVRRLAAQSLGELDNLKRAPARLIAAVSDSDPELRIITAMSLGEIGDSAAVPALSKAFAGAEPRFRYAIVKALAETDDRRGDAVLVLAARDSDQAIRRTAAEALKDRHEDREDDDD